MDDSSTLQTPWSQLVTPIPGDELEEHEREHHDLRYVTDPVAGIKACKLSFIANEEGYRDRLYELIATVYAIALRFLIDSEAMARLRREPGWRNAPRHTK